MRGLVIAAAITSALTLRPVDARGQFGDPAIEAQAARVSLQIERFTGPVDRHCGILLMPAGAQGRPEPVGRRAIAAALRCVIEARRDGRRTWALWQLTGTDPTVFAGLATSGPSEVHRVEAGSGSPALRLSPCLRPRVGRDAVVSCRNRPGPATQPELDDTVEALARDARRAFGVAGAAAVTAAAQTVEGAAAPIERPAAVMTAAQPSLQPLARGPWPACPYHHDHALQVRDRYWLCDRDGVFVAEVGRLPKRPRPRPLR